MTVRFLAVLAVALSTTAALPAAHAAPASASASVSVREALPLPPMPPDNPPTDTPAPVPNSDLYAPAPATQDGPALKPTLTEQAPNLPGGDPIPGTIYRYDQAQKRQFIPKPGLQLVVPLEK